MTLDSLRGHQYAWDSAHYDRYVRKTTYICFQCGHVLRVNSEFPRGIAEQIGKITTVGMAMRDEPCTVLLPQFEIHWPRCAESK